LKPVARVSAIDILPGRFPNRLRVDGDDDLVPVALLDGAVGSSRIDPSTVRFGPSGVEAAPTRFVSKDVDSDGDDDLLFFFDAQEIGIDCATTSGMLTAATRRGRLVRGSDGIVPRQCGVTE
jgi:hypothetical protein